MTANLRILVDAQGISIPGGGRTATLNWLSALLRFDTENTYTVIVDRPEPDLKSVGGGAHFVHLGVRNRFVSRLMVQAVVPWLARRHDIVHFSKNLVAYPGNRKSVVTIYDLSALTLSGLYPLTDRVFWKHVQPVALRMVSRIVAISQHTATEIVEHYGVDESRINVIYPTCHSRFKPERDDGDPQKLASFGIGGRFILTVGATSEKKNVSTLIRGFARMCRAGYDGLLVLVGRPYAKLTQEDTPGLIKSLGIEERVLLLTDVPDEALPALYRAADAFVLPSLCEGFGIAALEALSCGTPTVVSGTTAMAEVVGDAGILLSDPYDSEHLAEVVSGITGSSALAATMRRAGIVQSRKFTEAEAATQTIRLYSDLCPAGGKRHLRGQRSSQWPKPPRS